jgi:hypothetical protein
MQALRLGAWCSLLTVAVGGWGDDLGAGVGDDYVVRPGSSTKKFQISLI